VQDETAISTFAARNDDMIVSPGYNIAGPEVEAALLAHEADVAECAVIGVPDEERGQIVQAHVVLARGRPPDALVTLLAGPREGDIAPYKYPRSVKFVTDRRCPRPRPARSSASGWARC
jgi:2-aminobenzoate-CoA ligase